MIHVLVILLWAPLLALALIVLVGYSLAWRRSPARQGLLPAHVAAVTSSYLVLATRAAYGVAIEGRATVDSFVVIGALAMGLVAQILILRYERLRVPIRTEPPT